jgi:hypothetical protein
LGDAAPDDRELTDLLLLLRKDADWAYRAASCARPARGLAGEFKENVREEAAAMVGTSRRFLS